MGEYYAHIAKDGRKQSVDAHLQGTAKLCATFTDEFGAGEQGKFIGLLHDIGKYSNEFQKRLNGGPRVDHATAGTIESARAGAYWGAFCVAGHHSGIPNGGNQKDQAGEPTLFGRLQKGLAGGIPKYSNNWTNELLKPAPFSQWGKDPLTDSFLIRMLYSSLVDADYLDTEAFMKNGILSWE